MGSGSFYQTFWSWKSRLQTDRQTDRMTAQQRGNLELVRFRLNNIRTYSYFPALEHRVTADNTRGIESNQHKQHQDYSYYSMHWNIASRLTILEELSQDSGHEGNVRKKYSFVVATSGRTVTVSTHWNIASRLTILEELSQDSGHEGNVRKNYSFVVATSGHTVTSCSRIIYWFIALRLGWQEWRNWVRTQKRGFSQEISLEHPLQALTV
ncbi:hypothetical protein J6590_004779 [Homalodisca vitripennis]|nr:hypothetical protein J6590_004779 [Homalodisca vitripennis]